jgi:hypothetical protein
VVWQHSQPQLELEYEKRRTEDPYCRKRDRRGACNDPPKSKTPFCSRSKTLTECGTDQVGKSPQPEHEQTPNTFRSNGALGEVSKRLAQKIFKVRKERLGIRAQQSPIASHGKGQ